MQETYPEKRTQSGIHHYSGAIYMYKIMKKIV